MTNKTLLCLPLISLLSHVALAQTTVVAGVVNGVLNPTQFFGSDIGTQINTAWASGKGTTVKIPYGTYSFSTTINHPGAGYELECDAGTVLQYTGSGDAIVLPNGNPASAQAAGIDGSGGCQLEGNASAKSGIHLTPSNHTFVRNMRIAGFSNGYGIYITGANSVDISDNSITGNQTGIYLTNSTYNGSGYAANAIHVNHNEIASNSTWGLDSEPGSCACTENLGVAIIENVFEGDGVGDVNLNWNRGTNVEGNYFESSGIEVQIGSTTNSWGTAVRSNYFTTSSSVTEAVSIGYGVQFDITDNSEIGNTLTGCFINITAGTNGGSFTHRGIGTNYSTSTNEWCNHGVGTTSP
jgi:parallel beta-helix repeat protein